MRLISVIIPVYNVERYVAECIDSIINQEMKNIEIVLVNDGSTDNSLAICENYAKNYDFIKVYSKPNGGLSDARNYGLKKSVGEYVIFIDSDDTLEKDFLSKLSKKIKENHCDIIMYKHKKYYEKIKTYKYSKEPFDINRICNKSKEQVINYLIKENQFEASACLKAVKKQIIIKNDIYFTEGMYCEDIDWSLKLFCYIETFDCINEWAYIYRQQRDGSITNNLSYKNLNDLLDIIEKWYAFFTQEDVCISETMLGYLAYQYCIVMGQCNNLRKNDRVIIKGRLIKLKYILDFSNDKKSKLVKSMNQFIGMKFSMYVLNIFIKIKDKGLI